MAENSQCSVEGYSYESFKTPHRFKAISENMLPEFLDEEGLVISHCEEDTAMRLNQLGMSIPT